MRPCPFHLRPLTPADEPAYRALFGRLTPEEIRWRFGHTLTALPDAQVRAWCNPDGAAHHAWAAVSPEGLHGVARAFVDPSGTSAEFAILVEHAHQGTGVGRSLAEALLARLDAAGVKETVVSVAADNVRMLRFARRHGFVPAATSDPFDRRLVRPHPGIAAQAA